jgi:hypothetical protein
MGLYKFAWLLWLAGATLIVLSWTETVSREVGWAGFVTALIAVALSAIPHIPTWFGKPPDGA